jgi:MFS family permease
MMSTLRAISKHLGIATLILAAAYYLYTRYPTTIPHPEDMSPAVYLVATAALLFACLRLWPGSTRRQKWTYGLILLLCSIAFLDEIGWGVEVFGFTPYFSTKYNVRVYDLHSWASIFIEMGILQLQAMRWDAAVFRSFLNLNTALVLAGALFVAFALRGDRLKEKRRQAYLLKLAAWLAFALGLLAIAYLLSLPQDPANAWLFGYSLNRLGSMLFILVLSAAPLALLRWQPASAQKRVAALLEARASRSLLYTLLALLLIAGIAYQLYVAFAFLPDVIVRLERVTPLVIWAMALVWLFMLTALLWRRTFSQRLFPWLGNTLSALAKNPAFIYAVYAVLLIALAQIIDKGWIDLNNSAYLNRVDATQDWSVWIEENFETIAGLEFAAASLFFPRRLKKKRKGT